jgi:hypothetical protein
VDVAHNYATHIPAGVIASILRIYVSNSDQFRTSIHSLELDDNNPELRDSAVVEMSS